MQINRPATGLRAFEPVTTIGLACVLIITLNAWAENSYIGTETCAGCHSAAYKRWQGSHHDGAMQVASERTVLGNFNNKRHNHRGVISTFSHRDGQYYVNTQDRHGQYKTFKIDYVFGLYPLQQYLVGFPDGRYQALTVAWDSRSQKQGGQRWYQLIPEDVGPPGDSLHWTGFYFNWNAQCADCHSTGLEKNYSANLNQYKTTWTDINVGCEACHGPGSQHSADPAQKLPIQFSPSGHWAITQGHAIATAIGNPHPGTKREIEACAGCHSRRSKISANPINNNPPETADFQNHFQLQTLQQGLYHADGQIQDEVYVYGSFIQSKMYQRGVRCSNCHEPHSLKLKAEGNRLCTGCHAPSSYNTAAHHFHGQNSAGAECVNCHMPTTTYMGVDERRDHRFSVPNPRVSKRIEAPDACTRCHSDKTSDWAGNAIDHWLSKQGRVKKTGDQYAKAIYAGRTAEQGAEKLLLRLANSQDANSMARSGALALLNNYPTAESYSSAQEALHHHNSLIRIGALKTFEFLPVEQRWQAISSLLSDPIKAVRLEATRLLLGFSPHHNSDGQHLEQSITQYIQALKINEDTVYGQINLGNAYLAQRLYGPAQQAYKRALVLDPNSIPAVINLADSMRAEGRQKDSLNRLLQAQKDHPRNAALLFALGLAQIRNSQLQQALHSLQKAVELAPEVARYSYVYAIALHTEKNSAKAIETLLKALAKQQNNRELLFGLATLYRDTGQPLKAKHYAEQLVKLFPWDSQAIALFNQL